ncbi:hypothetical protein [Lentzea flaviverrucosa]|uniref:Uncharacterized protein n=1 Tax=Lentzea flaviverrucosa TaxID=200379 RepID=A0A1H9XTF8_9PSEU|nr:hypothetical protein [Lentzea flaviverrucosa]RDI19347.1 hypothetical protein DFR72_117189 [Lentzea flaviverrucosa]SES48973.1 hypothetical protein SAMN05216195_11728 [Lentzea flaviverrucosa]
MRKKFVAVLLGIAALVMFGAGTASAAGYYFHKQYPAGTLLADKGINFYVNEGEVKAGRDGWCHVPGDRGSRAKFWSCTVGPKIGEITSVPNGEVVTFNDGITHIASKSAHYKGQLPYCLPHLYSGHLRKYEGTTWYYCAYWKRG